LSTLDNKPSSSTRGSITIRFSLGAFPSTKVTNSVDPGIFSIEVGVVKAKSAAALDGKIIVKISLTLLYTANNSCSEH